MSSSPHGEPSARPTARPPVKLTDLTERMIHGPQPALFEKSWALPDIERHTVH